MYFEVKPAAVNRELSRLRYILKCGVDWGTIRNNPCRGIKELKKPQGTIRYLSSSLIAKQQEI